MYGHIGLKVKILAVLKCIFGMLRTLFAAFILWNVKRLRLVFTVFNLFNQLVLGERFPIDQVSLYAEKISGGIDLLIVFVLVIGFLAAWISTWALFAIGEAADAADSNEKKLETVLKRLNSIQNKLDGLTDEKPDVMAAERPKAAEYRAEETESTQPRRRGRTE